MMENGLEIAVIGMAGRFPGAENIHEFWDNLKEGIESITFFTNEDLKEEGIDPALLENPNYIKADGMMQGFQYFDAAFFGYTPKEAEVMDPQIRIFHEVAWTTLEDAGYDPIAYEGLIGLYAGASPNPHWEARALFSGKSSEIGDFTATQLTRKDYLSLRISYKLNLEGPSFVLYTACSTSLVAVHLASQAILNGECDMALAGGAAVLRHNKSGYLYQEGMINSADGHCRAFDARAKGIIGGDGVAVVLLKRLEDTLLDRDHIYAVVKGSAVNNDGLRKAGFTAPSVEGQAEVIKTAMQMAEVETESIGYIETHGTATELGDPVEIEGLKLAFNTNKKNFCGIGSVKTNVGHLDAAAGVTGFIKTVLMLKHRYIPPSLYFETPNPVIDFINSPFYVNASLTPWENSRYPRRAGVSSFGIGGTNAHVILEEAPEVSKSVNQWVSESVGQLVNGQPTDGRGGSLCPPLKPQEYQLILLSAKTEPVLETMTQNLADFFKKHPDINLADAAYTLQVGRAALNHRRMVVCSSVAEAIHILAAPGAGAARAVLTGRESTGLETVAPAPDKESLYNIGRLWLQGHSIDWKKFYSREKRCRIPLPTYPFEKQRYWIDTNQAPLGRKRTTGNSLLSKETDMGNWFYLPTWKRSPAHPHPQHHRNLDPGDKQRWLIFESESNWGHLLVRWLLEKQQEVMVVKRGEAFTRPGENPVNGPEIFTVNPGEQGSYKDLFSQLSSKNRLPHKIIHCWNVTGKREKPLKSQSFEESQWLGFYSLLFIAKTIEQLDINQNIHVILLSDYLQEVIGGEELCPEKAPVLGLVKAIPQEYPGINCRSIDILLPDPGSIEEIELMETLLEEFTFNCPDPVVAFRNNQRWVEIFEPFPLLAREEFPGPGKQEEKLLPLREQGVYLITGGLGKIGLMFSELLAKRVGARLVLTGRSPFPAREQWSQQLETHDASHPIARKIKRLQQIEKMGGKVFYFQADAAYAEQMKEVVTRTEETVGKINGVIHAAGIVEGRSMRTIRQLSLKDCQLQFQSKAYGLMVLGELFKNRPPDFFWLLSSISCVLAGLGFAAYASANLFMDMFAKKQHRLMTARSRQSRWFSLNWDGMQDRESIDAFERIFSLEKTKVDQLVFSVGGALQARIDRWIKLETVRGRDKTASAGKETASLYPRPDLPTPYKAPVTPVETVVANIWKGILGYDEIGIHDDFLELGGDSLKSITVLSRIHQELDVNVPLTEFFSKPTIERIARYISDNEKKDVFVSIEPVEEKKFYAVSSAQKRLYTLHHLEPDNIGYNMSYILNLQEECDKNRMEQSFRKLIKRHESLRTSFKMIEDEPVQVIQSGENVEFEIEYYGQERLPRNEEIINSFIRPFDLSQAPLLRVGLIKTGKGNHNHILMVDMHHIISDGISLEIFLKEFTTLYLHQAQEDELPGLRLQYKDFSQWQNTGKKRGAIKEQEEFWLQELKGEIPILNIPTDYSRPAVQSFEGHTIGFGINAAQAKALNEIAQSGGATLFMVLLAVYYVFLSKISSQGDIIVGTPVVGRRHTDLSRIMGVFVNTIALRGFPAAEKSFLDFLKQVKEKTLKAFENQEYQFEDLVEKVGVERDMSRNPLFDAVFDYEYILPSSTKPGEEKSKTGKLQISSYDYEQRISKFDLSLHVFDIEKNLSFAFEYCTRLFREETINRFANFLKKIISSITGNPGEKIAQIEITTEEDRNQILNDFNDTGIGYPKDQAIHQLFASQVERTPDNIAVIGKVTGIQSRDQWEGAVTYIELNRKSAQLANLLRTKGIETHSIVGIMMERSIGMIIGILAILKAGGAYLPIDLRVPNHRVKYMLEESHAGLVLTQTDKINNFEEIAVNIDLIDVFDEKCYLYAANKNEGENPDKSSANSLAYVIYTSGSTGKPKGVMVEHGNVGRLVKEANYMDWLEGDKLLLTGAIAFDITTFEIWGPLLNGITLVLVDHDFILDAEKLGKILAAYQISILHLIPQLFNHLMEQRPGIVDGLRCLLVGGDLVRPYYVNIIRNRNKKLKILHMYGPTENTTFSTFFPVENEHEVIIPIGKPLSNSTVYIIDKHNKLLPIGVAGELLVGGDGVARGYLNNPQLTAEKFDHDLWDHPDEKLLRGVQGGGFLEKSPPGRRRQQLYRTGDLAYWLPDGNIFFLGRVDNQVKIRGVRIELGEIESQLLTHENIKEAVVIDRESEEADKNEKYLCAYIVPDGAGEEIVKELSDYLSARLPDYMIPSFFVYLDKVPITPNGKIDRKMLPEPGIDIGEAYRAPRDEVEEKLVDIWADILGVEKSVISIDSNFFRLGGHSLKATGLVSRIHKALEVKLELSQVFKTPTIAKLAQAVKKSGKSIYKSIQPVEKNEYYPLSSAQNRMFMLNRIKDETDISDNTHGVMHVEGNLNRQRLENVVKQLIKRHEALRTSFELLDETPLQRVHKSVDSQVEYYDISNANPGEDRGDLIENIIQDFIRPFDLTKPPLMRVGLAKAAVNNYILIYDLHHIITDGGSGDIFVVEFMRLYGGGELPALKIQYKDFAVWQNNLLQPQVIRKQEEYWMSVFPGDIPVLNMPTDFPRPQVQSFAGDAVHFQVAGNLAKNINKLVTKTDTTLYIVLSAIFNVVLSKYTGQEDIVIGTAIAGRGHDDLENVIGFFVNTLAIRNYPKKEKSFTLFLEEVKDNSLKAYENQDYQFDQLVKKLDIKRDPGRHPLFDFYFLVHNENFRKKRSNRDIAALNFKPFGYEVKSTQFDIIIHAYEGSDVIDFDLLYCTDLFKPTTIEEFIADFKEVALSITQTPGTKLADIKISHGLYDKKLEFPKLDFGF